MSKKLYCKSLDGFYIQNEFKYGEFKTTDYFMLYLLPSKHYLFFQRLRRNVPFAQEYIGNSFILKDVLERAELIEGESRAQKISDFFATKEAKEEFAKIYDRLVEHGYIRSDGFRQSVFISSLIYDTRMGASDDELLLELYETVKPTTEKELQEVFEFLRNEFTPYQYQMIKFHIRKMDPWFGFKLANFESDTLDAALKNIKKSYIAEKINQIYDNTLSH